MKKGQSFDWPFFYSTRFGFCVVNASRVLTYIRTLRATLLFTPQNPAR
jgi:hypothetical protein